MDRVDDGSLYRKQDVMGEILLYGISYCYVVGTYIKSVGHRLLMSSKKFIEEETMLRMLIKMIT